MKIRNITLSGLLLLAVVVPGMGKQTDSALSDKEELGRLLYFDKISSPKRMACATCHIPEIGFVGEVGTINVHGSAARGAIPTRSGNRKPPSAAYATFSPIFHYDEEEGLFEGGNFWDGRATGELLGNPAADQALGPFLNPVEHNNADKEAVLEEIADSKYTDLWEEVWGEPITYDTPEAIEANYDRVGLSIAEFEASSEVNQFSSKYDAYLAGDVGLSDEEEWGRKLFNDEDKGNCAACHPSEVGEDGSAPLFTDFTYDNLGVPRNPENPFYEMDEEYLDDGSAINPEGDAWVDVGLAGFLATRADLTEDNRAWSDMADENRGKMKVPTLRNVDKRHGEGFPKAYMHNGYFKSLKSVVHFYNTRDRRPTCEDPFTTEADALKMDCWPEAEIIENINDSELGSLGLSAEEEDAIVAFMKTLSDGYEVDKGTKRR